MIHGWRAGPAAAASRWSPSAAVRGAPGAVSQPSLKEFRRQQLDLYIPAGDTGYWQGALRDPDEPVTPRCATRVQQQRGIWIDLLYGDYEGGQRTIVRFGVRRGPTTDGERAYVLRYWNVDRQDPR